MSSFTSVNSASTTSPSSFLASATGRRAGCAGLRLGLLGGVHLLAQLLRGGRQRFGLGFDRVLVVGLDDFLGFLDRGLDLRLFVRIELVAMLGQRLLRRSASAVGLVAGVHQFVHLLVFLGVRFGILDHPLDLGLAQARSWP